MLHSETLGLQEDGEPKDDPLNQLRYRGPLPLWWHKVLIDDNHQWPPDTINSYLQAYREQIELIVDELQKRWTECGMQGLLKVSISSPLQPYVLKQTGEFKTSFIINLADGFWNRTDEEKFFLQPIVDLLGGVGLIEIQDGVAVDGYHQSKLYATREGVVHDNVVDSTDHL